MATYIDNRKAHFNYETVSTYEAGLELLGSEVKSIKSGKVSLTGSFCIVRGGEVFVVGMKIPPYQPKNLGDGYDENRIRRLLLSKKEIKEIADMDSRKGLTIVPMSLYSKGHRIKVEVAIAKGKQTFDKRDTIKKRDAEREIRREYKVR